jgi:hypothetical protein
LKVSLLLEYACTLSSNQTDTWRDGTTNYLCLAYTDMRPESYRSLGLLSISVGKQL